MASAHQTCAFAIVLSVLLGGTTGRVAPKQSRQVLRRNSVLQNQPCPEQPRTLDELRRAFESGTTPSPRVVTGSWVAIGIFGDSGSSLDCRGVKRGDKFEQVMIATGYRVEMHVVGTNVQTITMQRGSSGELFFPFDFGGDASPRYLCRLTERQTLACLIDVYRQGVEFKRRQ